MSDDTLDTTTETYDSTHRGIILARHLCKLKGAFSWSNYMLHIYESKLEVVKGTSVKQRIHVSSIKELQLSGLNEVTVNYEKEKSKKKGSLRLQIETRTTFLSFLLTKLVYPNSTKVFQVHKAEKRNYEQQRKVKIHIHSTCFHIDDKPTKYYFNTISRIDVFQESSAFCIYYHDGLKKHIMFSPQREQFIDTIQGNMKDHLGLPLRIVNVAQPIEQILSKPPSGDQIEDKVYEYDVRKIRVSEEFLPKKPTQEFREDSSDHRRLLVFGREVISEVEPSSNVILAQHSYKDLRQIVRLVDDERCFVLDFALSPHPYLYEASIGMRDNIISALLELCERNLHLMDVNYRPLSSGKKIGSKAIYQPETEEKVMKNLASINIKAPEETWLPVVEEFNENFQIGVHQPLKEKKGLKVCIILLRTLYDLDMKEKKEKNLNLTEVLSKTKFAYYALIRTIMRLLTVKELNDSIEQYAVDLRVLLSLAKFDDPMLSYYAAHTLRFCIDQIFPHKNSKKEMVNKSCIFHRKVKFVEDIVGRMEETKNYSLMLAYAFECIELIIHSSVPSTEKGLFENYLSQIEEHFRSLFKILQTSQSPKVIVNCTSVIRIFLRHLKQKNAEKYKEIQEYALMKTMLLKQLVILLECKDTYQLNCSAELLGNLIEGYEPSIVFFRNLFPLTLQESLLVPIKEPPRFLSKKIQQPTKQNIFKGPASGLQQNWYNFAQTLGTNVSRISLIWNDMTRIEMKNAFIEEMISFEEFVKKYNHKDVVWNFEEFEVQYPSLMEEFKVGEFFLRNLIGNKDSLGIGKSERIDNPLHFMEELHHCITFEKDNEPKRLLAIQAMTLVSVIYKDQIGSYPYIQHIIDFIKPQRNLPLRMIYEIFGFLLQLLKTQDQNVRAFIKVKGIETIMSYINFVHLPHDDSIENMPIFRNGVEVQVPISVLITTRCIQLLRVISNFHLTVGEDDYIRIPSPKSKLILCDPQFLPLLIQLVIADDAYIIESALQLLIELCSFNDVLTSNVYKHGLFYFLCLMSDNTLKTNAGIFAIELLKKVHRNQAIAKGRSFLDDIFPSEVVVMLDKLAVADFHRSLVGDLGTPHMIWNSEMRQHLRNEIKTYTASFWENFERDYSFIYQWEATKDPLHVQYPQLKDSFVIHHIYMENFVKRETWPENFALDEPRMFLEKLCEYMNEKYPNKQSESRSKEDVKLTFMNIKAQVLLFQQLKQSDELFDLYPGFVSLLNGCIAAPGALVGEEITMIYYGIQLLLWIIKINQNVTHIQHLNFPEFIAKLISTILTQIDVTKLRDTKSVENAKRRYYEDLLEQKNSPNSTPLEQENEAGETQKEEELSETQTLKSSVIQRDAQRNPPVLDFQCDYLSDDEKMLAIVKFCLDILMFTYSVDRVNVQSYLMKDPSLCYSLRRLLCLPFHVAGEMIRGAVSCLELFSGEEPLHEAACYSGSIIYLFKFIMDNKLSGDHLECAKLATQCLRTLAGFKTADGEEMTGHKLTQDILKTLYPTHFSVIIETKSSETLLDEYFEVTESPRILWNETTCTELENFILQEMEYLRELDETQGDSRYDTERLLNFRYKLHESELRSDSIFIRFYNKLPKTKIENIDAFFSGLCKLLKKEVNMMNNDQSNDKYHRFRIGIIVEAMNNMTSSMQNDWDKYHDIFSILISLITPDREQGRIVYYVFHLLYNAISVHGEPISVQLIDEHIIGKLSDFIYKSLVKRSRKQSYEMVMQEYVISLLFKLLDSLRNIPAQECIDYGIVLFTLFVMSGCSGNSDVNLKTKSYFLCSVLLKDEEISKVLQHFVPQMLIRATKDNPLDATSYYNRAYESPELIWNEQTRAAYKHGIITSVKSYTKLVEEEGEAIWTPGSPINYDFPMEIENIFIELYIDHPNYPVEDLSGFTKGLVNALSDDKLPNHHLALVSQSLLISVGNEKYYNEKAVEALALLSSKILELVGKHKGEVQEYILKTTFKLSHSPLCLDNMSQHPDLDSLIAKGLIDQADQIDSTLKLLLRLCIYKPKIMSERLQHNMNKDNSTVSLLIQYLKSQKSQELKDMVAQVCLILSESDSEIQETLKTEDVYDQYVAGASKPNQDSLMKSGRPPLISGNPYSYLSIELDKQNENKERAKTLFFKISEEGLLSLFTDPQDSPMKLSQIDDLSSINISSNALKTEKIYEDEESELTESVISRPSVMVRMNDKVQEKDQNDSLLSDDQPEDLLVQESDQATEKTDVEILDEEQDTLQVSEDTQPIEEPIEVLNKDEEISDLSLVEKETEKLTASDVHSVQEDIEEIEESLENKESKQPIDADEVVLQENETSPEEEVNLESNEDSSVGITNNDSKVTPNDHVDGDDGDDAVDAVDGDRVDAVDRDRDDAVDGDDVHADESEITNVPTNDSSSVTLLPPSTITPPDSISVDNFGPPIEVNLAPPMLISKKETKPKLKPVKKPSDVAAPPPGRTDLLADIRSGKFQLKKTNIAPRETKPSLKRKPSTIQESLMQSLQQRRKALDKSDSDSDSEGSGDF